MLHFSKSQSLSLIDYIDDMPFLYGSTNFLSLKTFLLPSLTYRSSLYNSEVDKSIALTTFIISVFILENV